MTATDTVISREAPAANTPPAPVLTRAAPRNQEPWRPFVTWAAAISCGLALWCVFFALTLSGFHERHAQGEMYSAFRESLALQTAPLGGSIAPGTPVALLSAPDLGINDQVVGEATTSEVLADGPGHRRDSALPGQIGVSVIYGRATLFGGPFGDIAEAKVGATIRATTGQGVFTFTVRGVRHVGDPYPQPLAATDAGLTLVTSEGASLSNLWQPDNPVYVDAVLTGKTKSVPALGGRPATVTDAEKAMAGDTNNVYVLVLLLALAIGAAALVTWGLARWGRWQVWLVGAPIIGATLWAATQTASEMLPNLM